VYRLKVSVIVATKDRGPMIDETISSLIDQNYPKSEYEVVIVDNRSAPENQKLLMDYYARYPETIRYFREENLGLSNARNCGIRNSVGDILVFIDDDAVAPRYWLKHIVNAFNDEPGAYAVGGRVIARFTTEPPEWLDARLGMFISNFDHGNSRIRLYYNEYPRGANMAFRREAFDRYGCFLDCFGRKGASLMSYEEIELCYRIEKAGHAILYIPDADVYHLIRGDRLNDEWFRDRFYWQGRSEGLFELIHYGHRYVMKTFYKKVRHYLTEKDRYSRYFFKGYIVAVVLNFNKRTFK
jgi:glycosyltransferase involved in cell wall biosynthesis